MLPRTVSEAALDRSAPADLWRRTLNRIPSVFGKLAYLTSLRDPAGRYSHHGLARVFGETEADAALRVSHEAIFEEWLAFSLPQQKLDVELYFEGLKTEPAQVVETWIRLNAYLSLAPASARSSQRRLFESDLRALMEVFRIRFRLPEPDREL